MGNKESKNDITVLTKKGFKKIQECIPKGVYHNRVTRNGYTLTRINKKEILKYLNIKKVNNILVIEDLGDHNGEPIIFHNKIKSIEEVITGEFSLYQLGDKYTLSFTL